jgi:hypothetical protein
MPIEIVQDIYDPMYGGREFGVRDLNGYVLYFRRGSQTPPAQPAA